MNQIKRIKQIKTKINNIKKINAGSLEQSLNQCQQIKQDIELHQHNIRGLLDFAFGKRNLLGKKYSSINEKYQRTPADDKRLHGTLSNLLAQIEVLKKELVTIGLKIKVSQKVDKKPDALVK